jgi:WD40 repeat protein
MIVFKADKEGVGRVVFSPDGRWLATAGGGKIALWEPPYKKPSLSWKHWGGIAFSPDGRLLASVGLGLRVWDLNDSATLVADTNDNANTSCFSPDGKLFLSQTYNGELRRRDTTSWTEVPTRWGGDRQFAGRRQQSLARITYHPDGKILALLYQDWDIAHSISNAAIYLLDAATGKERGKIVTTFADTEMTFSPDGKCLAAVINTRVVVWEYPSGAEVAVRKGGRKRYRDLAFTPDGSRLVTVNNDGMARLWDTTSWKEIRAFDWQIGSLSSVAVSPDGMRIAVSGENGKVVIWDVE